MRSHSVATLGYVIQNLEQQKRKALEYIESMELELRTLRTIHDRGLQELESSTSVPPRPDLSTYEFPRGVTDFIDLLHARPRSFQEGPRDD